MPPLGTFRFDNATVRVCFTVLLRFSLLVLTRFVRKIVVILACRGIEKVFNFFRPRQKQLWH